LRRRRAAQAGGEAAARAPGGGAGAGAPRALPAALERMLAELEAQAAGPGVADWLCLGVGYCLLAQAAALAAALALAWNVARRRRGWAPAALRARAEPYVRRALVRACARRPAHAPRGPKAAEQCGATPGLAGRRPHGRRSREAERRTPCPAAYQCCCTKICTRVPGANGRDAWLSWCGRRHASPGWRRGRDAGQAPSPRAVGAPIPYTIYPTPYTAAQVGAKVALVVAVELLALPAAHGAFLAVCARPLFAGGGGGGSGGGGARPPPRPPGALLLLSPVSGLLLNWLAGTAFIMGAAWFLSVRARAAAGRRGAGRAPLARTPGHVLLNTAVLHWSEVRKRVCYLARCALMSQPCPSWYLLPTQAGVQEVLSMLTTRSH